MIPEVNAKLTEKELALIFDIREETVIKLAKTKQLPFLKQKDKMYFVFADILKLDCTPAGRQS